MARFVKVAKIGDLPPDKAIRVEADGEAIALFRVDGQYYALSDTCTHRDGSLCEGLVEGTSVTCPWHFARFDLKTGEVLGPPAPSGVRAYEVRVAGDDIEIAVS